MAKRVWHQQFKRSAKERRTDKDGTLFDSRSEMLRWHTLRLWQLAGHIKNLQRQVRFPLKTEDGRVTVLTPTGKVSVYTADFVYDSPVKGLEGAWERVVEDYKGFVSAESKLRISVFEAIYHCKVKISRR